MDIKGCVVVITGGASGLGKNAAEMLVGKGANVALLDISQQALDAYDSDGNILKIQCDITDEAQIAEAVRLIKESFEKIDVLINNAGILYSEPLINIMSKDKRHSLTSWKKVIDLNLTAPFVMASYIAEEMITTRTKGVIINISSISAKGNAGQSAYAATKAGLEALTKVWAKELGGLGIRAVAIAPGFMDTESTHKAVKENALAEMRSETALKRLGTAGDVSHAIKFVIENNYVTGRVIEVDGGLVI